MEISYPKHKHPHGVQNAAPNEYRIWVCEECGHIFTDDAIRKDEEENEKLWGHQCEKGRCESHLEPYVPDLLPKGDGEGLLLETELDYRWRKGLSKERDHQDAAREVAKAQQALDNIRLKEVEEQNADYQEDCVELAKQLIEADEQHQKEIGGIFDAIDEYFDCGICDVCYEDECGGELNCTRGKYREPCQCHIYQNRAEQNLARIKAKHLGGNQWKINLQRKR